MKILLSAIATLMFINCFAQQDLIFPYANISRFNWDDISKKAPRPIVDKFIKRTANEFQWYNLKDTKAYLNLDSLRKYIHFIDLNGDNMKDVIFEGQSSGEGQEIIIFINTGSSYKKVLTAFQSVVKLEYQDKRVKRLFVYDWGCCAEYIYRYKIYEANYNQTQIPTFKEVYQGLFFNEGIIPDTFLEKPFRFEVLNEGYKIRIAPQIDDTTYQVWTEDSTKDALRGNTIARLTKGTAGTAIAEKKDKEGRVWLFVQIDEANIPKNSIIYLTDKFPTKLLGWISSRFIKER